MNFVEIVLFFGASGVVSTMIGKAEHAYNVEKERARKAEAEAQRIQTQVWEAEHAPAQLFARDVEFAFHEDD